MITEKSITKEWIEQVSKTQKADKLNKLKKNNIEAFFYWYKVCKIKKNEKEA